MLHEIKLSKAEESTRKRLLQGIAEVFTKEAEHIPTTVLFLVAIDLVTKLVDFVQVHASPPATEAEIYQIKECALLSLMRNFRINPMQFAINLKGDINELPDT